MSSGLNHMVKKVFPAAILCLLLAACGPPQDGHGTREFDDGTKYVGEFKDGKRHGQGTATVACLNRREVSTPVNGRTI